MIFDSIKNLRIALWSRKISAKEIAQHYIKQIQIHNSKWNCFTSVNPNLEQEAEEVDIALGAKKNLGPLAGIPLGIKDMFCTHGLATTAASQMLANFIPPYDATVIAKLKSAGGLILGKLNQDEFAMGSSSENSYFGPVKNPFNPEYVAGGSSGGSAAGVAADLCIASLGTDTGGSIRQPAHFCGVVGLKPTYGRVSRWGIVAFASSLDQAGVFTRTVEDSSFLLDLMTGHDPLDSTSKPLPPTQTFGQIQNIRKGTKIGLIKEFESSLSLSSSANSNVSSDVLRAYEESKLAIQKAGGELVEVSIPAIEYSIPIYYIISSAEASSNLARYDGVKYGYRSKNSTSIEDFYSKTRGEGFGSEVKRRIMLGTFVLSAGYYDAWYIKAARVRRLLVTQFRQAFEQCSALICPVASTPAFRLNQKLKNPVEMYYNDLFTTAANLVGLPAISVPVLKGSNNLPVGLQIMGDFFHERAILDVALTLENQFGRFEK